MRRLRTRASSSRVRVMHVVEAFCGGVFSSVRQIVNALPTERFEVWLVYSLRPETPADYQRQIAPAVHTVYLPMRRAVSPQADYRAAGQLLALMRKTKPDVVHCHSSKAGMLGRWAARRVGVARVFYSPRGFAFLRGDVSRMARVAYFGAEWAGARLGGTITACSAGELAEARALTRRAALVNNALDLAALDATPLPRRCLQPGLPVQVSTCGRVCAQKVPHLFAALARQGREGVWPATFRWIGDGEDAAAVQELREAGVEITGWLDRSAALGELAATDIYLHTSQWEGLPLAVLEAMALGKPVVATDVIGNRDAVGHGRTGILGGSAQELSEGLRTLIRDEGLRQRMGRAGRERVEEEFNLPRMMARWQDLYEGAGAAPGPPPGATVAAGH